MYRIDIRTYIHTYIRTYIHAYMHTYIHTYIHSYIYTSISIFLYISTSIARPFDCLFVPLLPQCIVPCVASLRSGVLRCRVATLTADAAALRRESAQALLEAGATLHRDTQHVTRNLDMCARDAPCDVTRDGAAACVAIGCRRAVPEDLPKERRGQGAPAAPRQDQRRQVCGAAKPYACPKSRRA
jgi:hypothetical protein